MERIALCGLAYSLYASWQGNQNPPLKRQMPQSITLSSPLATTSTNSKTHDGSPPFNGKVPTTKSDPTFTVTPRASKSDTNRAGCECHCGRQHRPVSRTSCGTLYGCWDSQRVSPSFFDEVACRA